MGVPAATTCSGILRCTSAKEEGGPMHCRACEIELDPDDNYCRKCGAPVRVLDVAAVPHRAGVVKVGPSAPAILVGAARPVAAGAAAVAAGALMKFAVRQ